MNIPVRRLLAGASTVAVAATVALVVSQSAADASPATQACGTALSSSELTQLVSLTDTATITGPNDLARYDVAVTRNQQATAILAAHKDFRGLFAVGLDISERNGLSPLQHTTGAFADPAFGHAFSLQLLRLWLSNLHRQLLGSSTDPQWTRYFDLAHQCSTSKTQIAMAGYNAHLQVDIPHALAAVHATKANQTDFNTVVGAVALQSPALIGVTDSTYGTHLGAVWQVVISNAQVIGSLAFANGLGLQVPALASATETEIQVLWRATDAALPVLVAIYGG